MSSTTADAEGSGRVGRAGQIWPYLQQLSLPELRSDLVSEGVVLGIEEHDGVVIINLDGERCDDGDLVEVANDIRDEVDDIDWIRKVKVTRESPPKGAHRDKSELKTPLQAELMEEGVVPEKDPLGANMSRPDVAPRAGYSEKGPDPLEGPGGTTSEDALNPEYEGELPVFQWEVDPQNDERPTGEAEIEDDDWEYRLWWQQHPKQLVYASIRALETDSADRDGEARPHAVGRAVVVNLVYDLQREGVIAVYGTTRDFRPFVDAFEKGYFEVNHA